MSDAVLPAETLAFFPVQFLSRRELSEVDHLSTTRGEGIIYFRDTFGGARASMGGTTAHRAIDIMAPRGVPVFATLSAHVPETWTVFEEVAPGRRAPRSKPAVGTVDNPPNNDGGNYVVMIDGNGRHHYYAHLNQAPLVAIGERVRAGQLLGYVGNTGRIARSTPPHLHYQVTTRPDANGRGGLTFWNPYGELRRLALELGGTAAGRVELAFDDFVHRMQGRERGGLIDPWSGTAAADFLYPWDDAFAGDP